MSVSPPPPPVPDEAPERETSSVELLWDLVFVFAVTQVTTLLAAMPSWGRFAQSMLVLALIWWAWSAFVWASNALEADSRLLRGYLLVATVLIFIAGWRSRGPSVARPSCSPAPTCSCASCT